MNTIPRPPQKTRAAVNRAWVRNRLAQKYPDLHRALETVGEEDFNANAGWWRQQYWTATWKYGA